MDDLELAYVEIEVPDPAGLTPLFAEVIGLVPGESLDGASTWRNDDRAHRLVVREGPANDAVALGFEAAGDGAFDATVARLDAAGCVVTAGTDAEAATRRVRRLAHTTSPWGVRVEVVEGLARSATPYSSALVPGGFLTEGIGFGHAVFATQAFAAAHTFVVDGLGFTQSDWLEADLGPGLAMDVHFYHCNARHHTLALAHLPFDPPQRLHHLMVEVLERDDVGAAFDRAWDAGLPIASGLGRHDNDGMFSFYVTSPSGFQVEVGHGAKVIDGSWDGDRRYDRISSWGHQPLARP